MKEEMQQPNSARTTSPKLTKFNLKIRVPWMLPCFLGCLVIGSPAGAATFPVGSTFDTTLEGWSLVPVSGDAAVISLWIGGNPGGSVRFTDGGGGGTGTIRAPAKFLGDWSALDVFGHLEYEHRIVRLGGEPVINPGFCVWIWGSDGSSAVWRSNPDEVSPSTTNWVRVVVPIAQSYWSVTGNWSNLLRNVSRLELQIEQVINHNSPSEPRDQDAIDNVFLFAGCPPATIRLSEVEICWPSHSNKLYQVDFRSELTTNMWLPLFTNIVGNGDTMCVYDKIQAGQPQRFYRLLCP